MTTENNQAALHELQKFEVITIRRDQINFASYNPRTIGKENRKLLNRNLDKRGLMETLVWNKATGNLVSGHRRLEHLDEVHLKKYADLNYSLTVAMVELTDQEEKEQNIFFNNPNAMGDWDRDLMIDILPDIDPAAAGFTAADLSAIGIEIDLESHQDEAVERVIQKFEDIKKEKKEISAQLRSEDPAGKDWRDVKRQIKESHEKKNPGDEDYVVITFSSSENKSVWMTRLGFDPKERYIKGEVLIQVMEDMIG